MCLSHVFESGLECQKTDLARQQTRVWRLVSTDAKRMSCRDTDSFSSLCLGVSCFRASHDGVLRLVCKLLLLHTGIEKLISGQAPRIKPFQESVRTSGSLLP